jgi:hypothetical protein
MNRWLKLLGGLAMSVALIAAPCKNCEPKPAKSQPQNCGHDCCPKPKPEQQSCKWQPADYAASEAKKTVETAPESAFEAPVLEELARPHGAGAVLPPQRRAEAPPLYLSHRQLRN